MHSNCPGPFGSSKFLVRRDDGPTPPLGGGKGAAGKSELVDVPIPASAAVHTSPRYYALSTNITAAAATMGSYSARNNLVLSTSTDLILWHVCETVLSDDTGLSPADSIAYTGFEYPDFIFHGKDIVAAVRTYVPLFCCGVGFYVW
jgi:hypothetical protein